MNKLTLQLLGQFRASSDDQKQIDFRTKKVQALLIYLVVEQKPQGRDRLMTLLWPGLPEPSARSNLRQILYYLRQALPEISSKDPAEPNRVPMLNANRQTIGLNPAAAVDVDVHHYDLLLDRVQAHTHADIRHCLSCRQAMEQAITLYQGHFLTDFYLDDSDAFEEWAQIKREQYRRSVLDTLEVLTAMTIQQNDYISAQKHAARQLEIDNLRESAYRQLMEILALSGRRQEALEIYGQCQRLLSEELGMAPSKLTMAVYGKILAGELTFETPLARHVRGFDIKEEIGQGAFGTINLAYQPSVGREVVVKVIRQKFANDPEFIRRFENEAQTVARLEHPFIVPLYDYWRDPDGAYLVMRYLRGGNLLSALKPGPWDPATASKMLDQVAGALSAAHRQGVVHRDIKPANILLDEEGNSYLSDFGIAKDLTDEAQLTATGAIVGTLDYISPEQILNNDLTGQADIYSLGAVLYETLTGEKPFPDSSIANLIHNHLKEPVPLVCASRPDMPAQIDQVIQRATAKRPADRYTDALEMAEAFRSVLAGVDLGSIVRAGVADEDSYNPYKGLRAFQESDAGDFYGRDALITQLINRLDRAMNDASSGQDDRFLAVVGPSGSGKSSAVKAGLIPALREGVLAGHNNLPGSEKWFIAEMAPGSHPLEALELALWPIAVNPPLSLIEPMQRDTRGLLRTIRRILPDERGAQLLLLIDQFEELFTLVEDDERRAFFIDSLLTALRDPRSPLRVIATLRADFYDRPLQVQSLGKLLKENTEIVLPMTTDELTWAIREPARRLGVTMEPGLAELIVAGVVDQPGALPLVQYAMTELFDHRQGRQMTRQDYEEIGGVTGALGRRADEIYETFDLSGQETARQMFLRLITLGEGVEDTRRRVLRSELEGLATDDGRPATAGNGPSPAVSGPSSAVISSAIDAFGQARLLTFDRDLVTREPTVEVAHEALLREWNRLRSWLTESRDDLRMQKMLATAAAEWSASGEDGGYLLREARLDQFEGWRENSTVALTGQELSFLEASTAARQIREREEESRRQQELATAQRLAETESARAEEQTRAAKRLRTRALFLAGALVIALILAIAAFFFARQSNQESHLSFSRELAAAALDSLADDQERAVLLALQAINQAHTQEAIDALHLTVKDLRMVDSMESPGKTTWIAWNPEGDRAAASGSGGLVVWDISSGDVLYERDISEGYINRPAFSPDGTLLIAGNEEADPLAAGTVTIWDAESGQELLTFLAHDAWVQDVSFNAEGTLFATASGDGTVKVWELEQTVASGEGIERLVVDLDETFPWVVKFSPDGNYLATANQDEIVQLRDANSGEELWSIPSLTWEFDFSPDSSRLITSGSSGTLDVFDTATGQRLSRILAHDRDVSAILFSADGARVASGSTDSTVKIWAFDEDVLSPIFTLAGHQARVTGVDFSPDGERVISGSPNLVRIWDISPDGSPEPILLPHLAAVTGLDYNDDGSRLVTAGADGQAQIWNANTGEVVHSLSGHDWIWDVDYTLDGALLATAGWDAAVKLWDSSSGAELSTLEGHAKQSENYFFGGVLGLAFSPDDQRLATAGGDGAVHIWDVAELRAGDLGIGGELLTLEEQNEGQFVTGVAFSPDGRWVAASITLYGDIIEEYAGGLIKIWDVETGRELWTISGGPDQAFTSVTFSPDGKMVAAGDFLGQANVYTLPTDTDQLPEQIVAIEAGSAFAWRLYFSGDGSRLIVAHSDGLGVWDVETGEMLRGFPGLGTTFEGIYNTEETHLAAGGFDGYGRIFTLDVEALIEVAENRLTRKLTAEECQEYLHMERCPGE